jgi:hypothetical protein
MSIETTQELNQEQSTEQLKNEAPAEGAAPTELTDRTSTPEAGMIKQETEG